MAGPLAIDGGTPVRSEPMPSWPAPGDEEIAAVTAVLRSGRINYWTGDEGRRFEAEYAESVGRKHGIAVANGTLALELALRAFGIGTGDEVVVPARTFIATASAVVAVGARPVFADVDEDSGCMSAESCSAVVGPKTRAVIPVHLGGWPAEMDAIERIATDRGLIVIEDCAQAHGARYRNRPAGALGSHAGCFSFCQDKVLPVGEGGMLVLDDDQAYERAWAYKDHGKSLAKVLEPSESGAGCFRWMVDSFGTNWRLDELAAAMGRVGLRKLPDWHSKRTQNAIRLAEGLSDVAGLRIPLPGESIEHAFYRLYMYVEPEALAPGWDRDRIIAAILGEGVPVQYGTCSEIYREQAVHAAGLAPSDPLPMAKRLHETSLAFLVHPTLELRDIDDIVTAVHKVFEAAVS